MCASQSANLPVRLDTLDRVVSAVVRNENNWPRRCSLSEWMRRIRAFIIRMTTASKILCAARTRNRTSSDQFKRGLASIQAYLSTEDCSTFHGMPVTGTTDRHGAGSPLGKRQAYALPFCCCGAKERHRTVERELTVSESNSLSVCQVMIAATLNQSCLFKKGSES